MPTKIMYFAVVNTKRYCYFTIYMVAENIYSYFVHFSRPGCNYYTAELRLQHGRVTIITRPGKTEDVRFNGVDNSLVAVNFLFSAKTMFLPCKKMLAMPTPILLCRKNIIDALLLNLFE